MQSSAPLKLFGWNGAKRASTTSLDAFFPFVHLLFGINAQTKAIGSIGH